MRSCAARISRASSRLSSLSGDSIVGLNAQSQGGFAHGGPVRIQAATCVIAVEEVPIEQTTNYGIIRVDSSRERISPRAESGREAEAGRGAEQSAIAGRYVFSP